MKSVLIDTNVFVDYLRGKQSAIEFIYKLYNKPTTSVVVVAELYAGVRDGKERANLETLPGSTTIYSLTPAIAAHGGLLCRQFGKSHNMGLENALIPATATAEGATLITLNRSISV